MLKTKDYKCIVIKERFEEAIHQQLQTALHELIINCSYVTFLYSLIDCSSLFHGFEDAGPSSIKKRIIFPTNFSNIFLYFFLHLICMNN